MVEIIIIALLVNMGVEGKHLKPIAIQVRRKDTGVHNIKMEATRHIVCPWNRKFQAVQCIPPKTIRLVDPMKNIMIP